MIYDSANVVFHFQNRVWGGILIALYGSLAIYSIRCIIKAVKELEGMISAFERFKEQMNLCSSILIQPILDGPDTDIKKLSLEHYNLFSFCNSAQLL